MRSPETRPKLDASDPAGTLAVLKTLAKDIDSLEAWLVIQNYLSQTFMKLGSNLEPLRCYSADTVEPFEKPADPLAEWYRAARRRIPSARPITWWNWVGHARHVTATGGRSLGERRQTRSH